MELSSFYKNFPESENKKLIFSKAGPLRLHQMASPPLALTQSPPPKSPAVHVTPHCWSNLPLDLMRLVFERLGFTDFARVKSVCSSWLSGSRQSKPNIKIPWMILFPEDKNYCLLFDPENKEKLYKTRHLGDDFAKSEWLATYRSWLLMRLEYGNMESPLYILDLLTSERINLNIVYPHSSAILWIDEKTKDYLVIGRVYAELVVYFKKVDDSWKQILSQLSGIHKCISMVFSDDKLYCLTYDELYIFDFSGEFPLQVSRTSVRGCVKKESSLRVRLPRIPWELSRVRRRNNVVVTTRGDVLIVRSKSLFMTGIWKFKIFKMDSLNGKINWERIVSLRGEAILLDLGITVPAKDLEGVITSNSRYFNDGEICDYDNTEIFQLDKKTFEQLPQIVSSSVPFSRAGWFLPSFGRE